MTGSRLGGLLALIQKEFATILRDPKSRFVLIGPPILQFFIFGFAATFDVVDVPIAVVDRSRTEASRAFVEHFAASDAFCVAGYTAGIEEATRMLDVQDVRMILEIDEQFAEDVVLGQPARVQVITDGRNTNVAAVAQGYALRIAEAFSRERYPQRGGAPEVVERAWYNPNLRSRWFIVSCLGGIIATVIVTLLASLSVAREREFGTFDQLLATPLTPLELLVGKAVPPIVFGMALGTALTAAAVAFYGVPFEGSILAAVLALLLYLLALTGVGLFISSLANTMQQGLLGAFVFIMPAIILSGFTTSIANMPEWLQTATALNPIRWIVDALRAILLRGAGLGDIVDDLLPLAAIAAVTLTAAAWLFRHRSA